MWNSWNCGKKSPKIAYLENYLGVVHKKDVRNQGGGGWSGADKGFRCRRLQFLVRKIRIFRKSVRMNKGSIFRDFVRCPLWSAPNTDSWLMAHSKQNVWLPI